ncbi:MAG: hypothetical protein FJY85_22150, partial [Deltaproteobacteria bacterium]|nr:hypothetical protein [Deltaproteobacteria bacterium]
MFALKMRVVRVKKEKTEKINQVAHVDPKVEWARKVIVDYRGQKREECLVSYLKVLWEYTKYSGNKIVDHIRIRDGEFSGCKAQRVRKDSRDCPFV